MKRKKKRKAQHGSHDTPMQKITGMLTQQFAGVASGQLVTLRYDEDYCGQELDYYNITAKQWAYGLRLARHPFELAEQCLIDMDWAEGDGAPVYKAVITEGIDTLLMTRLWVYGTVKVEPLDFSNGFKPVAALLIGDPAAECGR